MASDWNATFKELFPKQHANSTGHYHWQEMVLRFWTQKRKEWHRSDAYGVATRERIERIIVLLVKHKLEMSNAKA